VQLLRTAKTILQESGRFFRQYRITAAQFNVLNVLGEHPEGMSQRRLSEVLVVHRSNVTVLLDRMAKRGWIHRGEVTGDRRAHRVVLTRSGRALWQRILPSYRRALKSLFDVFGPPDVKRAMGVLQTMESQARAWKAPRRAGARAASGLGERGDK
jgi:DNA-binding MarR family transcriptional regulator